eukprot:CAMPEP_0178918574 /NCGR_PEP_ID=MMETSP0786-20121207/13900_1 /TAXON_ID=186022 /ORGANISM="Thalassionema frauenfeldii, Strain CCMP 1798" /LENGTH=289 /DNA_ID=CAMNT_0020592295 /DNA_START=22 /DNA_END=891 /DNA_ORIENTATION=+
MNIALTSVKNKNIDKKRKLSYGLNNKTQTNVFGDTEDDEEEAESSRDAVNRELHREQELLRQRASAVVYDFDGTYDETKGIDQKKNANKPKGKRESRYMADLLKNAKRRNHDRDMAYERKMAREQELEEEENPEFRGKEKFITSAYKKKLEERELWTRQEEDQRKRDEEMDVTKRLSFYSNFNKNKAVGGNSGEDSNKEKSKSQDFSDGFEVGSRSNQSEGLKRPANPSKVNQEISKPAAPDSESIPEVDKEPNSEAMRQVRKEKIAAARLRYCSRRGVTEEEVREEKL